MSNGLWKMSCVLTDRTSAGSFRAGGFFGALDLWRQPPLKPPNGKNPKRIPLVPEYHERHVGNFILIFSLFRASVSKL